MISNELFESPPDLGQLAVDGEWEKAVAFSPGEFSELSAARDYLGSRKEVAFEAFFGDAFFGVRRTGTPEKLAVDIVNFAQAIGTAKTGIQFFQTIARSHNLELGRYFKVAEIGAVNAWGTVGAFVIPDPHVGVSSFDSMWHDLQQSAVARNTTHPKAIEFAFDNGDESTHWFALPLSSILRPYEIDRDKLTRALATYCKTDR